MSVVPRRHVESQGRVSPTEDSGKILEMSRYIPIRRAFARWPPIRTDRAPFRRLQQAESVAVGS